MNTHRASVKVHKSVFAVFVHSLFYTVPTGMFLTACNFLFESVRKYYFDWLIVLIPTLSVMIIGGAFELWQAYRKQQRVIKKRKVYIPKAAGYRITQTTELVAS